MSFEILDNLFQITVMLLSMTAAFTLAIRFRSRRYVMLGCGYGCFMMGTLYYVLHIVIMGYNPKIFYVSEFSWLAAYLFYLSLLISRTTEKRRKRSVPALLDALFIAAASLLCGILGPSPLSSGAYAVTAGAIAYLSVRRMLEHPGRLRQTCRPEILLGCMLIMQCAVYAISAVTGDFTRFNAYFSADLLLTLCMASLNIAIYPEERALSSYDLH